jgi:SSS family solute:Na+ symporter
MVAVSYVTREPDYERITGLTFGTITKEQREVSRRSWNMLDIAASALVLVAILAAYLYFRG